MKTMEERLLEKLAIAEMENTKLKDELEVTQEALNFLIMSGGVHSE